MEIDELENEDLSKQCYCFTKLQKLDNTSMDLGWYYIKAPDKYFTDDKSKIGKWLLFPDCETAIEDWKKIAAEVNNNIFIEAKISLQNSKPFEHVICVYTYDYSDVADVRSVGIKLWELGLGVSTKKGWDRRKKDFVFKPDKFTQENIYSDSGASVIYALRPGSTYLRKRPNGFECLTLNMQKQITDALENLEKIPSKGLP